MAKLTKAYFMKEKTEKATPANKKHEAKETKSHEKKEHSPVLFKKLLGKKSK
jgi:hypothetical protein